MSRRTVRRRHPGGRCVALLLLMVASLAQAQDNLELRVKSAFLFNFAKFVSWPAAKLPGAADPILFCVFEREPLGAVLETTLAGKSIESHPLMLRRVVRAEELRACQIAYLGAGDADSAKLQTTLAALGGSGVLSVYDGDATLRGGIVRFYPEDRKLRFEINASAADHEGIQVSSRLLGVASVVHE